jgi:hypothetical protein
LDPASIGTDQQPLGLRVGEPADLLPPAPQRLDRERGGVVVDPGPDPAAVAPRIVDPIGNGLAVGEAADQLLPLGIHAHHRLPGGEMDLGLLVEVAELGVPIDVLGALQGLDRALQPVALLLEQQPRVSSLTGWSWAVSAWASSRVDLQIQRSGLSAPNSSRRCRSVRCGEISEKVAASASSRSTS